MATAIKQRTNANRLAVFTILIVLAAALFCSAFIASHHAYRINQVFERLKSIYASDEKSTPSPSLNSRQIFPPDDPWNTDISYEPVDPNSNVLIASIGLSTSLHPDFGTTYNGVPWGIPYVVVTGNQSKIPVKFMYADESDRGPYPIPSEAQIEDGPKSDGDRHVLIVDKDNWILYELFSAVPGNGGTEWSAGSGAIFDLKKKSDQRPSGWTSADAAGLPILAGLARYDEIVEQSKLTHALRFTIQRSRRAFVSPASHFASSDSDANLPPMGMRVRLKAGYDISNFPPEARVILQGLKTYGMIVADNGGNWFLSGAPDPRWSDSQIETLKKVKGSDFEVVRMGKIESH
jgi:hypothetical protein